MLRRLLFLLPFLALPAAAETCTGKNLILALPPAELAALRAEADVPYAHGNLWSATRNGQEITLAGTYHRSDPRFDAIEASLVPYLNRATALLVESGPAEERALKTAMAQDPSLVSLAAGPGLPDLLPPGDWALLSVALRARGMAPAKMTRMQPWLLATVVGKPTCMFPPGPGADRGLEKRLMALARARGLPVRSLEPYDAVLSVFAKFSAEQQLDMLSQALAMDARSADMAATLADTYFAGESRLFWAFSARTTLAQPGMTPGKAAREMALVDRAMISSRNAQWIGVLEGAAAEGPILAAFGALHLPGKDGVLNLLARRGWAVTPLIP